MDLFCRIIFLENAAKFSFFCRNLSEALFNVSFTLSVECDVTIFSRTFFAKSHDDIEAKIHTGIVFVLTARIQEC